MARGYEHLNETETRSRFLDHLFQLLGWPVGEPNNIRVRLEPYHIEGRPDYAFLKENGDIAFLVEAKRAADVSVPYEFSRDHIFQAKRYAYSMGVGVVALTNFAETRVYAVTAPPDILLPDQFEVRTLRTSLAELENGRSKLRDFLSLAEVDNHEALERLLSLPRHGDKKPVTTELLGRLLQWRLRIAQGYRRENAAADIVAIDHAASLFVDRVLLSKILIDRGLEENYLLAFWKQPNVDKLLRGCFDNLHARYNGKLFARDRADTLRAPTNEIRYVLEAINDPKFPFDLAHIPIEILGDVYESFIGMVLAEPRHGTVALTPKESIKKQNGVYFTPPLIVRRMCADVLESRLARATYTDLVKIRVLDPACGSGTFLVAAYRMLLQRALDYWRDQPNTPRRRRSIYTTASGEQALTIEVKREILRSCIFGVDIDEKAVELTALSLYIELLGRHDRAHLFDFGSTFPELIGENLLVADALRLSDVAATTMPLKPLLLRILDTTRFDTVIGNPPYVFGEWLDPAYVVWMKQKFATMAEQADLYVAFLESVARHFLAPHGLYAFIVPDPILARAQRQEIRELLLAHAPPEVIYHVGPVFAKVNLTADPVKLERRTTGVSAVVLCGQRDSNAADVHVCDVARNGGRQCVNVLPRGFFHADPLRRFLVHVKAAEVPAISTLLASHNRLRDILDADRPIARGEETGKRDLPAGPTAAARVALIPGEAVEPFYLGYTRFYVNALRKPRAIYDGRRVLVRKTDSRCFACRDDGGDAALQSVYILRARSPEAEALILAVLNSRIINWFVERTITAYKKMMPQLTQDEILELPLPAKSPAAIADAVALIEQLTREAKSGLHPDSAAKSARLQARLDRDLEVVYGVTPGSATSEELTA